MDIYKKNILKTLTVNIQIKNLSFDRSRSIGVLYRVYYKVMNTLAPRAKIVWKLGESLLFESNPEHTSTYIPRLIPWSDLLHNQTKWNLEAITNPIEQTSHTLQPGRLSNIIEYSNGSVELTFNRPNPHNNEEGSSSTPQWCTNFT